MQKNLPFNTALDLEIIMLASVHFQGDFEAMQEALESHPLHPLRNYPIERIVALKEHALEHPDELLSLLPQAAQKAVTAASTLYQEMEATLHEDPDGLWGKLYALVLYQGENPYSLIDTIVLEGEKAVPPLIDLLQNHHLFDPLYPGFGEAPARIAETLRGLQEPAAIAPLFDALLEQVASIEERLIQAIASFDEVATDFLLHELEKRPFSLRSSYAAKALLFLPGNQVGLTAIDALCDPKIVNHPALINYLIGLLDGLDKEMQASLLKQLLEENHFTKDQRREIESYLK